MVKLPGKAYTVKSGDTLSAIAERFYGDPGMFQQIADANQIADPDAIQPRQKLVLPEIEPPAAAAPQPQQSATPLPGQEPIDPVGEIGEAARRLIVEEGDTLSAIAEDFYGDPQKYLDIAEANGLTDPDLLQVGQELLLPNFEAPDEPDEPVETVPTTEPPTPPADPLETPPEPAEAIAPTPQASDVYTPEVSREELQQRVEQHRREVAERNAAAEPPQLTPEEQATQSLAERLPPPATAEEIEAGERERQFEAAFEESPDTPQVDPRYLGVENADEAQRLLFNRLRSIGPLSDRSDFPAPPEEGSIEEWYREREKAIEAGISLDRLYRKQYDAIIAKEPLAAATTNRTGDIWRTVKNFADQFRFIRPAGGAEGTEVAQASQAEAAEASEAQALTPEQQAQYEALQSEQPQLSDEAGFLDKAFRAAGAATNYALITSSDMASQGVVGGARDAAMAALELIDELGITDDAIPPDLIPDYPAPRTGGGAFARDVAQFLYGFGIASKMLKWVGWGIKGGFGAMMARGAATGFMADFAFFSGQEESLADLMVEYPALRYPILEYFAGDDTDSELDRRFRRALEGVGLGIFTESFFWAVKSLRSWRARQKAEARSAPGAGGARFDAAGKTYNSTDEMMVDIGVITDQQAQRSRILKSRQRLQQYAADEGLQIRAAKKKLSQERINDEARLKTLRKFRKSPEFRALQEIEAAHRGAEFDLTDLAGIGNRDVMLLGSRDLPATISPEDVRAGKYVRAGIEAMDTGVPDDVLARSLADKNIVALGQPGGPRVFANFAAVKTPDELQQIVNDLTEAYLDPINAARRDVVSHAQTRAEAGQIDAFGQLMKRRPGEAPNAAEVYAYRSLYEGALQHLQKVATLANQAPTPENLLQFRRMMSIAHAIQKDFYGARAEAGRALNAFRIPVADRHREIEALMQEYGGATLNGDLAGKLALMLDRGLVDEATKMIEGSWSSKTRDAIQQWFYFSILSGTHTQPRNLFSNLFMIPLRLAETAVSARMADRFGGEGAEIGQAMARATGMRMGLMRAFQLAAKTARTGQSAGIGLDKYQEARQLYDAFSAETLGLRKNTILGRFMDGFNAVTNVPGRLLMAGDDLFKSMAYDGSRFEQAFAQVQKEIRDGELPRDQQWNRIFEVAENLPADMSSRANLDAMLATFTEPIHGRMGKAIQTLRAVGQSPDDDTLTKLSGMAIRMMIPFFSTPYNIMRATFERTPLAPVARRYKDAIARGGADAALARTKMAMGTSAMLVAIDLAIQGKVTGAGPRDWKQRQDLIDSTGWQPYSIKIGDEYYSYQGLEPISTLLGWSASIGEMLVNADESDPFNDEGILDFMAAAGLLVAENIMDKSYLSSFSDVVAGMQDPTGFGPYVISKYAGALLVPNVVRDVTRAGLPFFMEGSPERRYVGSVWQGVKARWNSETLAINPDFWGRPKSYESGLGVLYDLFVPFYRTEAEYHPVARDMLDDNYTLAKPQRAITVNGQRISLNTERMLPAYSRLLTSANQKLSEHTGISPEVDTEVRRMRYRYGDRTMLEAVNALVTGDLGSLSRRYQDTKDREQRSRETGSPVNLAEEREKMVKKVIGDYRDLGRMIILEEYPEIERRSEELMERRLDQPTTGLPTRAEQLGFPPEETERPGAIP